MALSIDSLTDPNEALLDPITRRLRQIKALSGVPNAALAGQQPDQAPPLTPEEHNSLLAELGAVGGSALHTIGSVLDYFGRPVRGLLGGHPEELGSLIPFSDTLGITDQKNEVSGRGMLENWGVLDKQPEGAGFFDDPAGNVAGIAASIATDPLSWVGLGLAKHGAGALSQAGKVARTLDLLPSARTGMQLAEGGVDAAKAAELASQGVKQAAATAEATAAPIGRLAKGALGPNATAMSTTLRQAAEASGTSIEKLQAAATAHGYDLDKILDQPLSGLVGVGPPVWGANNWLTLGHGPMAQGVANTLDDIRNAVRYSGPGRFVSKLFDVPSKQMGTRAGQIVAQEATEATEAGQLGARTNAIARQQAWQDLGLTPRDGLSSESAQRAFYENTRPLTEEEAAIAARARAGEDVSDPRLTANRDPSETFRWAFPTATDEQAAAAMPLREGFHAERSAEQAAKNAAGLSPALKDETADYVGRQAEAPPGVKPRGQQAESLQTTEVPGREEHFKNQPPTAHAPGGTGSLNMMADDAHIVGPTANEEGVPLADVTSAPNGEMLQTSRLAGLPPDVQKQALDAFNKNGMLGMAGAIKAAKQAGVIGADVVDALNQSGAFKQLTRTTPEKARDYIFRIYRGMEKPELDENLAALAKYRGMPDKQVLGDMAANLGGDKDAAENAFERLNAFKAENANVGIQRDLAAQGLLPRFPNDPETDSVKLAQKSIENANAAQAVARHIGRMAQPIIGSEGDHGVPITQNLKDSGLAGAEPIKTVAEGLHARGLLSDDELKTLRTGPVEVPANPVIGKGNAPRVGGAAEEIDPGAAKSLETHGAELQGAIDAHESAKAHNAAYEEAVDRLKRFRIPNANAADNNRIMEFMRKGPESLAEGRHWFQGATQLFKAWNTAPWPANKIRDFVSGVWQMFAGGHHYNSSGMNPLNWTRPLSDAKAVAEGGMADFGKIMPHLTGLSPEEATAVMRREMYATNLHGGLETAALNANGAAGQPFRSILDELPGAKPFPGILPTIKGMVPGSLEEAKPWNIRGIGGRTEDVNSLIRGGRELSDFAWSLPRDAIYFAERSKGTPMQEAARIAKAATVDFDRLTPFERKLLRPMLPFATWTRHMVPWLVSEMAHNPGGVTAQAVRLAGGATQPRGFVPKQLEGGVSLPLTSEDESGNQKYLAGFDLPFETIGDLFHPGRTSTETVGNTLAGWAGFLNPAMSIPIELATNRQLYTGRELSDLHGRLGYIAQSLTGSERPPVLPTWLEEVAANGPTARIVSTTGKWLDPRKSIAEKAINTLTGIHTSDIDMPFARSEAQKTAAEALLSNSDLARRFTEVYVPHDKKPLMTEREQKLYAIYQELGRDRQARIKADKAKAQGLAP